MGLRFFLFQVCFFSLSCFFVYVYVKVEGDVNVCVYLNVIVQQICIVIGIHKIFVCRVYVCDITLSQYTR